MKYFLQLLTQLGDLRPGLRKLLPQLSVLGFEFPDSRLIISLCHADRIG